MTRLDFFKAGSQSTHKESATALRRILFVVALIFGFSFNSAHAATGLDYLSAQQNPDGSFGNTVTSLATPVQSTAEVLRAYQALGPQSFTPYAPALGYLNNDTEANTEFLARKIIVNAKAGYDVTVLINMLVANQNTDGGFGNQAGNLSSVLDTSYALEALAAANYTSGTLVSSAAGYLLSKQTASGGWANNANDPSVFVSAQAMRALWFYRNTYVGVSTALTNAQNFLLAQRGASGTWSEPFETALALLAIAPNVSDLALVDGAATALTTAQLTDGSWANDPYTTALALQAISAYQARKGGATPTLTGAISGYVVRAGSTEPISGAQVTLAERPGTSVLTNSAGYFLIPSLPPGTYTVTASKTGYTAASLVTSAQGGQVTLAGTLALNVVTQNGLVVGKIFDAQDLTTLPGASVTLTGGAVFSAIAGADGKFNFGALAPGDYAIAIALNGYVTVNGTATVVGGQTLTINQGLIKSGGFQDTSPGTISGTVVNASTGLPIAGAVFDLGGGLSGVSSATGQFIILNVPRGNYAATLTATGYVSQAYTIAFPDGATGNLGVLSLYAASSNTAPTSLTLNGLVVDGVSRAPIAGATVTLVETGATVTSGADGRFVFGGITIQSFTLATVASGYQSGTLAVSVNAFGQAEITVALAPPGTGASTSTLAGTVRDAQSNTPVAGARVSIDSTSFSAVADANGHYTLSGIDQLHFRVTASAVGYQQASSPVDLAAAGSYTLDPVLQPVPAATAGFQVLSVSANQPQWGADATALFTARIASLLAVPKSELVIAEVVDASGVTVASLIPYAEGTTTTTPNFNFDPNETKTLTIPWSTARFAPGTYTVIVRVVEPGTIAQGTPRGQILAENYGYGTLVATMAIDGAMAVSPPLTQAGAATPVALSVLVRDSGNVPLPSGAYELTVTDATGATTLYSVQAMGNAIDVGANVNVDFGTWVPTASGNLNLQVRAVDTTVPGTITGRLYVGDKASGTFTVDKTVVPEGTQKVRGRIGMQGVDVRTGSSTDPLFALVKDAAKRGGQYVAPTTVNFFKTNRCNACHVTTQSYFGLASALDRGVDVDRAATQVLRNALAISLRDDGSLVLSNSTLPKVQTSLGLWSLSASSDKSESFRERYKATKYLYDQRVVNGNQTHWTTDHYAGWWYSNEAMTALALSGLVDVVQSAPNIDLGKVIDYSLSPGKDIGMSQMWDAAVGPDGAVYLVSREYSGTVKRLDWNTGQLTTITSGLWYAYSLAFAGDGTLYVSSAGLLQRVIPGGSRQTLFADGGTNFTGVEVGPDGWVYVADYNRNRILRVPPTGGQPEVYVSGGLLRNPYGLAFDGAGNLYIANLNGNNVLKVAPDRTVTVFIDGMITGPFRVRADADGNIYVTSMYADQGNTYRLIRMAPDGAMEVLAASSIYGHLVPTIGNGRMFVANQYTQKLHEVLSAPIDTASLAGFRDVIAPAARYLLGVYRNPTNDNVIQAMRLTGLGYARQALDDQSLVAEIDVAMAYLDNLLRGRQRADGGWGFHVGYGSDPLVTAMIGLAIDYTNPSPDDPQVRKAIQFLLNSQMPDGSWNNVSNGFTTRLTATSFVMAYLPKALERLGGIDVDLHLGVPANVQLTNPSITPTTTSPGANGETTYVWKLLGVTNAGRYVDFDLTLPNMQLNESRPVATQAYLEFNNSFTADKLQVPLDIPAVRAASGMSLGVATDKQSYQANEPVAITASVTNSGPTVASGQVQLAIRAPGSAANLVELAPLTVDNLVAGTTLPLPTSWNTGTAFVGAYEVYGRLLDTQGRLLAEATVPFSITAPGAGVAATSVTTDKPVYEAWDVVQISGRVQNVAPNAMLAPTQVELTVRSPSGAVLFFETRSLTQLTPLALRDLAYTMILADAASGTYQVQLVLKDAFTRTALSTSVTSFQVNRRDIQGLTGSVMVTTPTVYQGDSDGCTETAKNVSATTMTGVRLIHQLISVDTGTVVNEVTETVDLATGGVVHSYFRNIDTRALAIGGYSCVIKASFNGATKMLAFGGFRVVPPPIRIDASLTLGAKSRLLVLLDHAAQNPDTAVADADPYGPDNAPGLTAQRAFVEKILKKAGWSYTITDTAEDFARELRTGGYSVYALLTEQDKLAEHVQKELREAVFRGEGLFEAGSNDQRQGRVDEALGIKYIGQLTKTALIELTPSPIHPGGQEAFLFEDKELRAELQGAQSAGRYLGDSTDRRDAVTYRKYGAGKSVYAGFDLLAHATAGGEQSQFAALLLNSLNYIHPANHALISGAVIPVDIALTNQGIAAQVQVQLPIPAGTTLVDAGTAQIADATLTWQLAMPAGESKTLTIWLRLPAPNGSFTLTAKVLAGANSQSLQIMAEPNLTLAVNDPESLTSVVNRIDTLLSNQDPNSQSLMQARKFVEKALANLHPALAIDELLKAADSLVGITDPEVVAIRVAIGQWIRWASPYAF